MVEVGPATSRRARTGAGYLNQWTRFVPWSQASGRFSLPASPEGVAPLPLRKVIGRIKGLTPAGGGGRDSEQSQEYGFEVRLHHGITRTTLDGIA